MLDFGWQEFLVLTIVTVLFVGPKELPRVFRAVTGLMRKARSLAGEFHSAMDEMAREADLQDIKKEVNKVKSGTSSWTREIDPTGEVGESMRSAKSEFDSARQSVNRAGKEEAAAEGKAEAAAATTPKPHVKDEAPSAAAKTPGAKTAGAKKTAAKKVGAKKSAAKTAASKTASAAKKATAKKATAKKATAKKATAKKGAAKKSAAKTAAKAPAGGGSAS